MEEKRMAAISEGQEIINGLTSASSEVFASFDISEKQDKIKLYNATTGDGDSVKSHLNKVIDVVDVVVMPVDLKNDDGVSSTVPRVTLITKDGKFLSSSSWGVYNSIKKIASLFGGLHFDEPLKISPVEVQTKKGFTINLKLI